jgi:hypothetical protein
MVRHCVRLTTPARTCSNTYQRRPRRGILGRRPPSCFSLRLMAWMTSALRRGKSSLRYSCRPGWCRKGLKAGKTNRDKKPRCAAGLSTMTSGEGRPTRRHFNARMSVRFQPLTTLTAGRSNLRTSSGPSGSGGARLGPSQKDGLPIPLLVLSISVQGHRRAQGGSLWAAPLLMRTYRARSGAELRGCRNLAVSSRNVLARERTQSWSPSVLPGRFTRCTRAQAGHRNDT